MRVLLVTPYDLAVPGGVNRHVRELGAELRAAGDEVRVVGPASAGYVPDDSWILPMGTVRTLRLNGAVTRTTLDLGQVIPRLRGMMRDYAPDVVHVHEPVAPLPCAAALWLAPPAAVRVGTFHTYAEQGRAYQWAWPWCRLVWSRLDVRIAVSEAARDYAARHVAAEFIVVRHGVKLPPPRAGRTPEKPWRLLFVGRMDEPRKGFSMLLEALRALGGDARLIAIGPGAAAQRGRVQGLPVELRGQASETELAAAWAEADLACVPSLGGESFGLVALEALARGVPVVASRIRGYAEWLGEAAELVTPGDPAAWAAAIRRVASAPELYADRVAAGRRLAQRHNWPEAAANVRREYTRAGVRPRAVDLAESALQNVLRGTAAAAGYRRSARRWRTEDFRGRACHCAREAFPQPAEGAPVHWLHSEGLRETCDFVVDFGSNVAAPGRPQVPVDRLAGPARGLRPGATVHVKTDLLGEFIRAVLPSISVPIVLVTGDSDASAFAAHGGLLEDARIAHWFAQNCDRAAVHPKLTRLPIGLDNPVYTKLEKRLGFALTMALGRTPPDPTLSRNDLGDQRVLAEERARLPDPRARPARALCTFHQNQKLITPDLRSIPARLQAWTELRDNPNCHFISRRLPQRECWRIHGQFAFEVSPRGKGLDCFRTWEALILGTIPIVLRSPLDELYRQDDWPVVIVDSWREITTSNLEKWQAAHGARFDAALEERLTNDYWSSRINGMSQRARGEIILGRFEK